MSAASTELFGMPNAFFHHIHNSKANDPTKFNPIFLDCQSKSNSLPRQKKSLQKHTSFCYVPKLPMESVPTSSHCSPNEQEEENLRTKFIKDPNNCRTQSFNLGKLSKIHSAEPKPKISVVVQQEGRNWLRNFKTDGSGDHFANRPSLDTYGNSVKLIILGGRQVGKSALTVRYLTKRYIGEYKSHSDLHYRQRIQVDGQVVELEIVDVSDQPGTSWHLPIDRVRSSDAVIVMYSITDRASFTAAAEAMSTLTSISPRVDLPVLILANKIDLNHLRQVSIAEGEDLSKKYNSAFHEVSVADNPIDTIKFMNNFVKELWAEKLDTHTNSPSSPSTSPPGYLSPSHFDPNSIHIARKSREGSPLKTPNADPDLRFRKISVFNVSKVISHLMGRGSLPPELPAVQPNRERSVSSSAINNNYSSLKKVFKKRSV